MARFPTGLIPPEQARDFPERDYGIDERVEAAAVLLGTMLPTQVAKRLVAAYGCGFSTAYDYIASAKAFIAGLDRQDHETAFHDVLHTLRAIRKNPSSSDENKLKAAQLEIGMRGLRREPPRAKADEAAMFDREE